MFNLPRAVWLLGFVSLATDAASEAIYPLLPFFLTRVLSAGAISVGIVEGAAEAANSLLKIVAGRMADRSPAKRPLVLLGYSVSSAVRPLIALATTWTHVFTVRVADRIGKGVRTAPRDAMLAAWATPATRGLVYGFHQGMDNLGAVIGPALATLFLILYPDRYRTLFALTIVPGAVAVLLILLVPERGEAAPRGDAAAPAPAAPAGPPSIRPVVAGGGGASSPLGVSARVQSDAGAERLPRRFYAFIGVLSFFMLGNSTDAFLLLRLTDAAGSPRYVPLMWAGIHVVKTVVSLAAGAWSDRVGRRTVIAIGWLVYAAVYAGFAISATLPALLTWFMVYGCYYGFAEGVEKALVADLAPAARRGTAFGYYNAVSGIGALTASIVFGLIWRAYGAPAAFGVGASIALVATAALFVIL